MATEDFHSVNSLSLAKRLYVTSVFSFIVIDDATKEVVYRDYIDISVAVATPRVRWARLGSAYLDPVLVISISVLRR